MSVSHHFNFGSKTLTIKVPERFDFDCHQSIREIKDNIPPGAQFIVFDLSKTVYMDSAALGMLLVFRDKAVVHKQSITLSNVSPYVKKVLEVALFHTLFTIS